MPKTLTDADFADTPKTLSDSDFSDSGSSVMDPHPVRNAIKRFEAVKDRYDPTVPANMGRVAPIAAGIASAALPEYALAEDAGIAAKVGMAALGGGAAPIASAATANALGENADYPSTGEVLKQAGQNAVFFGLPALSKTMEGGRYAAVKPEIEALPEHLRTTSAIKQAVKNRDFLKQMGMNDEQVTHALANPDEAAAQLQKSIEQGKQVKSSYQAIVDSKRAEFTQRYDEAYGPLKDKPADVGSVKQSLVDWSAKGGQHELTPSWRGFLDRKAQELTPDPLAGKFPPEQLATLTKTQRTNLLKNVSGMQDSPARVLDVEGNAIKPAATTAAPASGITIQQLRDLRTEIRENVPGNATPLDLKAAQDLNQKVTDAYEGALRKAGASEEQIGRLKGIDDDYGNFRTVIDKLDPRSAKFGEQAADAMYDTAKQNPEHALYFVKMAKDAGHLPEFREQLLNNIVGEMKAESGGPLEQMRTLRQIQDKWGSTDAGKAVLKQTFGADSPMADPVKMAKVLGAANDPKVAKSGVDAVSQLFRSPTSIARILNFYLTYSLITGSPLGPWTDVRKDPMRALTGVIGAMASTAGLNKIMSHVTPEVQDAYTGWLLSPSEGSFNRFVRASSALPVAGATVTGITSQPKTSAAP